MGRTDPGVLCRLRYLVEYAALRTLAAVVGCLPEKLAVWAGVALGKLLWLVAAGRRRVARRNIELAMPDERTTDEVRRLIREVFSHIGLTAVESLWMRNRRRHSIDRRFSVHGVDAMRAQLAAGRPVLAFGPHLGNWELFGACMAAHLGRLHALARPVNNPLVRNYTTRLREESGICVHSTRHGLRPMIKTLRNGETLAILFDQHVNRAYVASEFFGRKAATTAILASLALRLDAPVFAAYSVRQGHTFRHHGYIEGPLDLVRTGDHQGDVRANTQLFNDKLEEIVRRHPEQWLWTHRRWKLADRLEQARRKEDASNVG